MRSSQSLFRLTRIAVTILLVPAITALSFASDDDDQIADGFALVNVLRGHEGAVFGVAVTGDGQVVSTGIDGTVRMWDTKTGEEKDQFQAHQNWSVGLSLFPDSPLAVTSGNDGTVRVWDLSQRAQRRLFEGHTNYAWAVDVSSDGKLVLSGSHDQTSRLWSVRTGREVRRFVGEGPVWAVALSPDGRHALSTDARGVVHLWDTRTGEEVRQLTTSTERAGQPGHRPGCVAVEFSPDGSTLLTGAGRDGDMLLWDVETGKQIRRFEGHTRIVRFVRFSPGGKRAVTTSYDMTVRLWDLESGAELARYAWPTEEGKQGMLFGVAFTPDEQVVAAGADGTIRILEVTTADASPAE